LALNCPIRGLPVLVPKVEQVPALAVKIEEVKIADMSDAAMIPPVVVEKVKVPHVVNRGAVTVRTADEIEVADAVFDAAKNTHNVLLVLASWPGCLP
jgi:hypothetical protein